MMWQGRVRMKKVSFYSHPIFPSHCTS
uniref:Uncharacterized protein n=1 Tax=Arundo donax TaxID=35708 RepID=A0A0A9A3Y7_ARUDO